MKTLLKLAFSSFFLLTCFFSKAQDFDSGSTGADGDLIFDVANGATQEFDHLASGHEGIWNFNTIVVPVGVTVTFPTPYANATPPVVWLAQGNIEISGTLDLRGENGFIGSSSLVIGSEPRGGPGGFAGGISGGSGYGPGGGQGAFASSVGSIAAGTAGTFSLQYGNRFLQPLIGGSGGGGARNIAFTDKFASGGGGGGALLLSSSTSIQINGEINCDGGLGASHSIGNERAISAQGSGGGIRLIADQILGTGTLLANPNGRIAIESFDISQMHLNTTPIDYFLNNSPTTTFTTPVPAPQIRVTDVVGVIVADPALGRTDSPDVFFADSGAITVTLECANIPLGTILTVVMNPTASGAPIVTAQSTPLIGIVAQSTATAQLTVPAGRGIINAFAYFN